MTAPRVFHRFAHYSIDWHVTYSHQQRGTGGGGELVCVVRASMFLSWIASAGFEAKRLRGDGAGRPVERCYLWLQCCCGGRRWGIGMRCPCKHVSELESISRVRSETLTWSWCREASGSVLPLASVSLRSLLMWWWLWLVREERRRSWERNLCYPGKRVSQLHSRSWV